MRAYEVIGKIIVSTVVIAIASYIGGVFLRVYPLAHAQMNSLDLVLIVGIGVGLAGAMIVHGLRWIWK